jgi:hypothetical protein
MDSAELRLVAESGVTVKSPCPTPSVIGVVGRQDQSKWLLDVDPVPHRELRHPDRETWQTLPGHIRAFIRPGRFSLAERLSSVGFGVDSDPPGAIQ